MAFPRFSSSSSTKIWEHLNRILDNVEQRSAEELIPGVILVRCGRVREVLVSLTASIPQGANGIGTAIIPAADRPDGGSNARGSCYFNGQQLGQLYVETNGNVGVVNQTGAARTSVQARASWTV